MRVFVKILGKAGLNTEISDPDLAGIAFILDDGQELYVKEGDGGLRISSNDRLVVEPQAANAIQVRGIE